MAHPKRPARGIREVEARIAQPPLLKERLERLGRDTGFASADGRYTNGDPAGFLPLLREALASSNAQAVHIRTYGDDDVTHDEGILNEPSRPRN